MGEKVYKCCFCGSTKVLCCYNVYLPMNNSKTPDLDFILTTGEFTDCFWCEDCDSSTNIEEKGTEEC